MKNELKDYRAVIPSGNRVIVIAAVEDDEHLNIMTPEIVEFPGPFAAEAQENHYREQGYDVWRMQEKNIISVRPPNGRLNHTEWIKVCTDLLNDQQP